MALIEWVRGLSGGNGFDSGKMKQAEAQRKEIAHTSAYRHAPSKKR